MRASRCLFLLTAFASLVATTEATSAATSALNATATSALTPSVPASVSKTRPNIVILLADDWGFTDVGAFGSEIHTPNLDALAQRGARFANFHATASCSPTRSMLLTGVDNHLNGVGNMRETIPQEHVGKPGYFSVLNNFCFAPVHAKTKEGTLHYMNSYYYIGHFSKFILPGARRIVSSSSRAQLLTTAFQNPDGSIAVVVMNPTKEKISYRMCIAGQAVETLSLPHSIATLVF